ncbi:uncharacterized protein [Procambarus clarkii]|uniref:uncharacterized protein n=1 Tax=Procambarus clarkii TaxID=6728 RepID=UPI0037434892
MLMWLMGAVIGMAGSLAHAHCHCGLFLVTSQTWRPDHLAFSTSKTYQVNCSDARQASQDCRRRCEEEVVALNQVFRTQPQILEEYHPRQELPCDALPAHTASFYSVCGSQHWYPASEQRSAQVCCSNTTSTPVWCEETTEEGRAADRQTPVAHRKIDTHTNQNAIENNEIQGATKPESQDGGSWLANILQFFGYKSVGDMVKNIDIFSLPGKVQGLVKTYNDEISMGQCYMEFTTFSLFKQDGALSSLQRIRRHTPLEVVEEEAWDLEGHHDLEEKFVALLQEARALASKSPGMSAIESVVNGLVGMLDGSPTTRQYADIIRQVMPLVLQVYTSDDPSSAITTFISQALGPYLAHVQTPSQSSNAINTNSKPTQWTDLSVKPAPATKTTPRPSSSSSGGASASSPITAMVLEFLRYYMGNYLSSLPGNAASKPSPPPPTRAPVTNSSPPPASKPASSSPGFGDLLNLLFASPRPQKVSRPKPQVVKQPQKPQVLEKHDTKTFVDMVLEFIRPVFISIIGKAPGESGVASIREVTRLSSLGRVDDTVVEEVLSPYFCFKNYIVNKAWTLTERGVRSVANQFNPDEQARMMRMLQE